MSAFAAALDTLFADPHLAADALWRAGGAGSGVPVRVMTRRPDEVAGFGGSRALMASVLIDVRMSDVLAPAEDDSFEVGAVVFDVIGAPRVDALRLIWTCEARERS